MRFAYYYIISILAVAVLAQAFLVNAQMHEVDYNNPVSGKNISGITAFESQYIRYVCSTVTFCASDNNKK